MVISGVVTLKMLARPESMCCSAQAKSRKGTTHSNNETTLKCAHTPRPVGSRVRVTSEVTSSATVPPRSRPSTTCAGDTPPARP